ncbi:MAG: hypothetical protein ACJAXK_001433 [Yoonia sp.]|jgi:hypothetical protein
MAMRGDWQLREVNICVRHHHPIVPLWEAISLYVRYDITPRLTEILPRILDGALEQVSVEPSPYDLWLDTRLEKGADQTWLSGHSLYAVTTFCRLLGAELMRLEPARDGDEQVGLAHAKGFEVVRRGVQAIKDALEALAGLANGYNDTPTKAFGKLFIGLNTDYVNEECFLPFRQILRDCIIVIWPVATGEVVLGIEQTERRLHSIQSASKETGISPILLEKILVEAGAVDAEDDRPISRRVFNAPTYVDLLTEMPTLVGRVEMETRMGATRNQLWALEADHILTPVIDIPKVKSPWRLSDGLELVSELQCKAIVVRMADAAWEGIQQAKVRSGLGVGAIINAIRDGKIQIGHRQEMFGYNGCCVLKSDIDQLKALTGELAENIPALPDGATTTAREFGRLVGMRDKGRFRALVAAGHSPASQMPNPKTGVMQLYMSDKDIEAFHDRFMTSTTMSKEFGEHRNSINSRLEAGGVKPFSPGGEDFGTVYLRQDINAAFGRN